MWNRILPVGVVVLALALGVPAWAANGGGGHTIIGDIALCVVAASVLGMAMKGLRQPLILGYILAGVVIGPEGFRLITDNQEIVTVSEIGLVLLLFMIGLEIDLRKMGAAGKLVWLPGLLQVPLCIGLALALFFLAEALGLSLGAGRFAILYTAVAVSLSSTMIVVKLLFDKMELDTLAGRITIGILVFQDLWAILALIVQPNLANPVLFDLVLTLMRGGLLVGVALLVSRNVLPYVFRASARLPELVLVLALGWCFLVALVAAHPRVGLSMEMGALIAGVSLATFPYNLEVIAKVVSIRDFFITVFFVALGMQIPMPNLSVVGVALVVAAVALSVRFIGVFGLLYAMRAGHRVSLLTTLNLAQVSEFSLVIVTMGVAHGHVGQDTLTYLIWVFAILAVLSTYLVTYSHAAQGMLSRVLRATGFRDLGGREDAEEAQEDRPLVLLGFYRIASAFLDEVRRQRPKLLSKLKVVDFNPEVREKLKTTDVACIYGDISHFDTLHHAQVEKARVVMCTIPDHVLKGTTNQRLLSLLRGMCPKAVLVMTAEGPAQALALYQAGADYVIQPSALAGVEVLNAAEQGLRGTLLRLRQDGLARLKGRNEVIA